MSDWVVPIVSAVIALAGGVYATRGKRATDKGDLADRLVDQVQEERDDKVKQLAEKETAHRAVLAEKDAECDRLRGLRQQDADYIVALRRQVEDAGGSPLPYPNLQR